LFSNLFRNDLSSLFIALLLLYLRPRDGALGVLVRDLSVHFGHAALVL
jgi:hypothetical protein